MTVIDADGHVEESPATFSFLDKEYYGRRPLAVAFERDTVYGPKNAVWLIDGKTYPKFVGKGGVIFRTPTLMELAKEKTASIPAQELTDVDARLRDLDKVKIDKQVVYPTLFLTTTTEDIHLEAALMRSYNSFMADACSRSRGRIGFAALVPIRDVEESIRELRRAKGLGAVAVMLHGLAWDKCLGDKALFPFYEEAANLNIPVSIHLGWGCPAITDAFDASTNFYSAVLPVLMGFYSIMSSGVLDTFPRLRFAFLESGSEWLPYVIHRLKGDGKVRRDPADYFREQRVYVGCEGNENLHYVVQCIGEDSLIIGSDYPHGDPFHVEDMVGELEKRTDLSARLREKMLSDNPQRLYGL
jgi:predicted TIM-barrel fold metal-dependent hydrolase